MSLMRTIIAAASALLLVGGVASAQDYKLGDLEIMHPVARATPPGAPVSGGYMTIRNNGSKPDWLIGGGAAFAGKVEIHEMAMEGDVMKMRQLANGLEIPPGGEVTLKPGGYHVMFMQMKEPLEAGKAYKVKLQFKNAGDIEVEVPALTPDKLQMPMQGNMGNGTMNNGNMNNGG